MDELTHLIDGEPVATDQWFHTVNPATRQPWARVARGSARDAARAVNAARVAFDEGPWPRMSPEERGVHLHSTEPKWVQFKRNRTQFVGWWSRTSALFRFANADNASATSSARPLAIPW